jgi:hypothetical protein
MFKFSLIISLAIAFGAMGIYYLVSKGTPYCRP